MIDQDRQDVAVRRVLKAALRRAAIRRLVRRCEAPALLLLVALYWLSLPAGDAAGASPQTGADRPAAPASNSPPRHDNPRILLASMSGGMGPQL